VAQAGTFVDSGQTLGSSISYAVALGDLDGDGDLDAFVANAYYAGDAANKVWLSNGLGIFTDSGQSLGSSRSYAVALGDLDDLVGLTMQEARGLVIGYAVHLPIIQKP